MSYTIDELRYGGKYHPFFWGDLNPCADIPTGLANCTTFTYGDCLTDGWQPVTRIRNANNWHTVANGKVIPFDINQVEKGDVLEWVEGCHVAKVDDIKNGVIYLNCSWYTDANGTSKTTYRPFTSLKQMSDFFATNYPTRFYHYWTLDEENEGVGDTPDYIIKRPTIIKADGENKNVDQIKVLTDEQNVRTAPNGDIVGAAQSGFYNVYGQFSDSKYIWYQIRDNLYIAGVNGRVEFIESDADIDKLRREIELLTKRNAELMNAIEKARKDLEV